MVERESEMAAEWAIKKVLMKYARAVDRFDLSAIEACYWPDAHDWHGSFRGTREEFMGWVDRRLREFERTAHYLANVLVEVQDDGVTARAETYSVAYHRRAAEPGSDPVDLFIGLRYVDRFERRGSRWAIAARVVTYEWARESTGESGTISPTHIWSERGSGDPLHWILERDLADRGRGPRGESGEAL